MAHDYETARTAVCEQDTIKLKKMGEELDAAAEYIEHLQAAEPDHSTCEDPDLVLKLREELSQAKAEMVKNSETIVLLGTENASLIEAARARPVVDQQERKDRGALLQVVYNLQRDNPDMSLEEGLIYISGAFAGESDAPILEPVEPPGKEPQFHTAEPEPEYEPEPAADNVETSDTAEGGLDWGLDLDLGDSLDQLDLDNIPPATTWSPPVEEHDTQVEAERFPTDEHDIERWVPPADEQDLLSDTQHEIAEDQQAVQEDAIEDLPAPVSATAVVAKPKPRPRKKKSIPSGPEDIEWDPSQWVPKPDEESELNELLAKIEPRAEELYGIKAFAKDHPELLQKPQK